MDIVALLYEQAREIAKEGHTGWGNTMVLAAEEIEKLRASQHHMHADAVTPCPECGGELSTLTICLMSDCDYRA